MEYTSIIMIVCESGKFVLLSTESKIIPGSVTVITSFESNVSKSSFIRWILRAIAPSKTMVNRMSICNPACCSTSTDNPLSGSYHAPFRRTAIIGEATKASDGRQGALRSKVPE